MIRRSRKDGEIGGERLTHCHWHLLQLAPAPAAAMFMALVVSTVAVARSEDSESRSTVLYPERRWRCPRSAPNRKSESAASAAPRAERQRKIVTLVETASRAIPGFMALPNRDMISKTKKSFNTSREMHGQSISYCTTYCMSGEVLASWAEACEGFDNSNFLIVHKGRR